MPIDYSKWKSIEVSDDEDDTHPNIDTPSLFRWRHQARLEKMAEMKQAKEEVENAKKQNQTKVHDIEEKLKASTLDDTVRKQLESEKEKIREQEEAFMKKERELAEQERLAPWNVDTIGKEAWTKTIINKPAEKKAEPPKVDDDEEGRLMQQYFTANEDLMKKYALLDSFEQCEQFLLEHPHLASDYASSYITIQALNLAIESKEDDMEKYAANCITLQYLLELAKSLKAVASNTNVIKNFFKKIRAADAMYMKMYYEEVEAFKGRLRKRAKDKIEEHIASEEAEQKQKRIEASPGGLDPQEVFDSLPEELQEAFNSQSMQKMMDVAERMDQEVFQYHLQRCIDSGLWIPNAKEAEEKAAAEKETKASTD